MNNALAISEAPYLIFNIKFIIKYFKVGSFKNGMRNSMIYGILGISDSA